MNPSLIPKSIHKMYLEGLNGLLVCEAMERLSIYFKNFITWKEEYTGTYTNKSKGCMQTFGHSWSKFPFVITSKSYKVMGNIIIKFRFFQLFYIFIFYIYKIKSNKRGPVFSFFCNKLSILLWAIMTDSSELFNIPLFCKFWLQNNPTYVAVISYLTKNSYQEPTRLDWMSFANKDWLICGVDARSFL